MFHKAYCRVLGFRVLEGFDKGPLTGGFHESHYKKEALGVRELGLWASGGYGLGL